MKNLQITTRNLKTSGLITRSENDEKIIEGVIPYDVKSQKMYLGYTAEADTEIITRSAFNKTIGDKAQVFLNYNHNQDEILGNTKSGTLTLDNQDDGLHFRCLLPNSDIGNRTYETISRGDCNTLSFEFYPREYQIKENTSYIKSAQLWAISACVPNPAYTQAESNTALRCLCEKRSIDLDAINEALEQEKINTEQAEAIKKLISELEKILPTEPEKNPEPEKKQTINTEAEKESKESEPAVKEEQSEDIPETNTEKDAELLTKLEEIQKELAAELAD